MLPGLHKVRAKLAGGVSEYWYAWRGGPRILVASAANERALDREVGRLTPQACAAFAAVTTPGATGNFLTGLIGRFLASGEYAKLGARRRADLARRLDVAKSSDIGLMPIKALESPKARRALIDWRDRYKSTPCTADARLEAVAMVTKWAKARGDIAVNPLVDWPRIYRNNRADAIWMPADIERLLAAYPEPEFGRAVRLAAATGLRPSDLIRLPISAVGEDAFIWKTCKSRGRKTIVIPIIADSRAVLDELSMDREVGTVLTNSLGKPWTLAGLQTAMQRARRAAAIKGLSFYDLRGTAATRFALAGLPLEDIAWILGWVKARVEQIVVRYVTGEALGRGMVERLKRNKA